MFRSQHDEGEVLDVLVQKGRNRHAAPRFLTTRAAVDNTCNLPPHLISRPRVRQLGAQAGQVRAAAALVA